MDRQTPPTGSIASYQSSEYLRQLRDYSFGTAPRLSNSPSTYPTTQDDQELEELMLRTDITPRPSVVAYNYQSSPRNSAWHHSSRTPVGQGIQHIPASRQTWVSRDQGGINIDIDSTPSSASASVTSFSESLYTGSVVSMDSSSAPQTPSNDFTSSEDDDERRNPFYITSSGPYPNPSANTSTTSMEFSSEEEYESDDIPDIDISSVRAASVDMSFQQEEYPEDSYASAYYLESRRGSLPMDIPGALTTPGTNTQYPFNRDREDSLINLRRPSRSLGDDLHIIETMKSSGAVSRTRSDDPALSSPISVPGSEGDWRNLNARARQRGSARNDEGEISEGFEFPSTSSKVQSINGACTADDFDLDWDNLRQGIVSFDRSQLEDIIHQPGTSGGPATGPRWFPRFRGGNNQSPEHARRQSVVTVTSLASDTFGRAITGWGGEGYKAQRKDWTFRREKTAGISQQVPGASASGNVGSRAFAGFLSSKTLEDDRKKALKEREKEKERLARVAASWRGMSIDSQEIWKMDLIGTFRVERKATKSTQFHYITGHHH